MIDLTKSIRRKSDGMRMFFPREERYYRLQPERGPVFKVWPEELERDYENFLGPRKPREWQARYVIGKWELFGYFGDSIVKTVRVIEWPEGKPLPNWPEE